MSDADSDGLSLFDPAKVCDRVTQRVNELWQTAVDNSIRHGPNLSDLQIPPRRILRGAWELRCALEDGVSKIRTTSGLVGEHLNRQPFINSPGVDPNWKMAEAVIKNWQELFFEPQRDNIERLIAGLRMATRNAGAQDLAVSLLDQFRESTILPGHHQMRKLVEKAIDLIQVTPLDVDNALGGADHAPPKNTQRPGDGQPGPAKSTEVEPNPVDDGKPLSDPVTNDHLEKLTLLSTRSFQNKASKTKDRPGPTGKAGKANIYSYSEQRKWFLKHWPLIPADRLPPSHQEAINLIRTNCPPGN